MLMQQGPETRPMILAVDDCPVTQRIIKTILGRQYYVIGAMNAEEALKIIYKEPIQVMLLDVSMPDIDGLELCRTIRTIPTFKTLPIIMLTSRTQAFDRVQGKIAGATEYLTKPFDHRQLHEVIASYLLDPLANNS